MFEQQEELDLVIELSKKLNIRPIIHVRAKLRTRHAGHCWSTSGIRIPTTLLVAIVLLIRLRANMRVIDVDGGIVIDYDGTKASDSDVSKRIDSTVCGSCELEENTSKIITEW
ncbi:hypothetical protein CRG98_037692 [Punica granatum]|uniref:Arginine decarboxylase n=1 Tax=Punica granatum TaxID=22663 RepID=A0A2I0ID74_PUNGR|nr:hypothetical protein CRG98_037692 [Punica granatum]